LIKKFQKYVDQKLLIKQKHPFQELYIYNYSQKVQFEKLWDDVTSICRGLILDNQGNIIANPFPKFFNYGEFKENLPNESFEVYKKMDGSLGILYWIDDIPFIATRGSFISEQAQFASNLLQTKYQKNIKNLDKNHTYLFEIIYPKNKIVVDYKNKEELILLAIRNTKTGEEYPLKDLGFPIVEKLEWQGNIEKLAELNYNNEEGFVVKFKSGLRLKIKFSEYIRLHRLITGFSNKSIWECLKNESSIDEFLERVPDEFFDWVEKTKKDLIDNFSKIEKEYKEYFQKIDTTKSRRDLALEFKNYKYPSILFNMLDKKNYKDFIWKILKPEYSKPFQEDKD